MMLLCPYHIYMCVCVSDEECVYVCDMMQSMCGLDLCFFLCQSPQWLLLAPSLAAHGYCRAQMLQAMISYMMI